MLSSERCPVETSRRMFKLYIKKEFLWSGIIWPKLYPLRWEWFLMCCFYFGKVYFSSNLLLVCRGLRASLLSLHKHLLIGKKWRSVCSSNHAVMYIWSSYPLIVCVCGFENIILNLIFTDSPPQTARIFWKNASTETVEEASNCCKLILKVP